MIPLKMPKWVDSIRSVATLLFSITYCFIVFALVVGGLILIFNGHKEEGQELIMFSVANFTGTAMGAIIAYFFKDRNEEKKLNDTTG